MQSGETSSSSHDRHDRLMVARFAAGDAYPGELDKAKALVESCPQCAALAADIRLIAARTADLPDVRRPRDFRISVAQAEQVRGSWLSRLLRSISAPGWTVIRPLAGAALVVGLSLAVIGALPLGTASSTTSDSGSFEASAQVPTTAPSLQVQQQPPAVGIQEGPTSVVAPQAGVSSSGPPYAPAGTPMDVYASAPTNVPAPAASAASATAAASGGGDAMAGEGNGKATDAATSRPHPAPASEAAIQPPATESVPASAAPSLQAIVPAPPAGSVPADLLTTPAPAAPVAQAATASPSDRSGLLIAGVGLAILALAVLIVAWLIRRRYSDPLVR